MHQCGEVSSADVMNQAIGINIHLCCAAVKEDGPVLHDYVKEVQPVHICQVLDILIAVSVVQLSEQLTQPVLPEHNQQ